MFEFVLFAAMIPVALSTVPPPSLHVSQLLPTTTLQLLSLIPTVIPGVAPDCSDLTTGFSPECFITEDVAQYLVEYNTTIRLEKCAPYQPWSQCFQVSAFSGQHGPTPQSIPSTHNCTYLSLSSSNSSTCAKPQLSSKSTEWSLGDWYGVWSIYQMQSHVSTWTQALLANSSSGIIGNLTGSHPSWNVSRVLATLVYQKGADRDADAALVKLLYAPNSNSSVPAQPVVINPPVQRVPLPNENAPRLLVQQWQNLFQQRMQELLKIVSVDFDQWFLAAGGGAFAAPTLRGNVSILRMNLAN